MCTPRVPLSCLMSRFQHPLAGGSPRGRFGLIDQVEQRADYVEVEMPHAVCARFRRVVGGGVKTRLGSIPEKDLRNAKIGRDAHLLALIEQDAIGQQRHKRRAKIALLGLRTDRLAFLAGQRSRGGPGLVHSLRAPVGRKRHVERLRRCLPARAIQQIGGQKECEHGGGGLEASTRPRLPQGRKSAVVIPPLPELHVHADAIRALARRSFDDIIDIGRRLARCRELLKSKRQWMAWLLAEFSWSRRTANRFIALFQAKDKLGNLPTLPMSSLYTLATASPKLIQKIERDIKAGERPSVAEIQQQVRADRLVITATPIT